MRKRKLIVYTNIPTPYQDDLFAALANYFILTVVYYARKEADRQWSERMPSQAYNTIWMRDSLHANWLQRWIKDYHF
ncbi:hypothetical protein LC612_40150, partial [Nostoc sp. CHAB 5834]|nr:hypothetical protein [Nostoc sp. CHAB 5834]